MLNCSPVDALLLYTANVGSTCREKLVKRTSVGSMANNRKIKIKKPKQDQIVELDEQDCNCMRSFDQ
ncbi:hypothetical protein OUZ56_004469 [Daphnia magna]|uniref:Uncharacterized protein n=1 Tax=Daphnia magna TaxID=35525 RepID=A0ABQ9YPV5_9CRUS|nr:hypothetical protein OUZ56_004469 [Daphnia magna]